MEIEAYLDALASAAPTPGGGSAAALCGAAAAALVAMVARITLGNPKLETVHTHARHLVDEADHLRSELVADRARDEAAYSAVIEAMALPRATEEEKTARTGRLQAALRNAAAVPLETACRAMDVLLLARRGLDLKNDHLVSDLGCAAEFAAAAIAACAYNVRINHKFLKDEAVIAEQRAQLEAIEREASAELEKVRRGVSLAIA